MAEHISKALKLAEPIKLGSLHLANRIVKASTVENMSTETGEVTERLIDFYVKQAKGGAGLLITGGAYVQPNGRTGIFELGVDDDSKITGLIKLTDAVHRSGGKIVLQIGHSGRQTKPEVVNGNVIGPSAVKDRMTGVVPRAMTEAEIEELITSHTAAAKRARQAGFDGIEVMAGHGYLINQFLSGRTNRRNDKWGGSLENRAGFLFRILERVKGGTGGHFPLLVKINTEDQLKKGFSLDECLWVAERLSGYGVDAIKLTGGTYESALNICRGTIPEKELLESFSGWQRLMTKMAIRAMKNKFQFSEAYYLGNAKMIKRRISIPVILVGGLRTPEVMERILREEHADLIALGRPLIREPNLPKKILSGNPDPASCINCNRCFIRIIQDRPLSCHAKKQ